MLTPLAYAELISRVSRFAAARELTRSDATDSSMRVADLVAEANIKGYVAFWKGVTVSE